jgi:germination protein M
MRRALLLGLLGLLLAGCGGDDGEPIAESATEPTTTELTVYFLLNGKLRPVRRVVGHTELVERAALNALVAGPTQREVEELGLTNEPFQTMHQFSEHLFRSRVELEGLVVEGKIARVEVPDGFREDGVAQIVYTLTQFPHVVAVDVVEGGAARRLRRPDFERFTPAILVESPLAYEQVTSPLRVSGTANTFEATFSYELKGSSGQVLAGDFVTATSGTGTRGTFELEVPFEIAGDMDATLVVFERSAKDGSRINEVEIPLRLTT